MRFFPKKICFLQTMKIMLKEKFGEAEMLADGRVTWPDAEFAELDPSFEVDHKWHEVDARDFKFAVVHGEASSSMHCWDSKTGGLFLQVLVPFRDGSKRLLYGSEFFNKHAERCFGFKPSHKLKSGLISAFGHAADAKQIASRLHDAGNALLALRLEALDSGEVDPEWLRAAFGVGQGEADKEWLVDLGIPTREEKKDREGKLR